MSQRFYISELHGDLTARPGSNPGKPVGVSFHILDRLWNHAIVATYRTEDWDWSGGEARVKAAEREIRTRARAEAHLARLLA